MNKFCILIQGPIHDTCLLALDDYLNYGDVVISCYDNNNTSHIENKYPNIKIIKSPVPEEHSVFNFNNSYYLSYTGKTGINIINNEFTIKTRTDQAFNDLDPLISKLEKDPDKLHFVNLYSFRDSQEQYCLGNHIFASKTSYMNNAYNWAESVCQYKNWDLYGIKMVLSHNVMPTMGIPDKHKYLIPTWSEILTTLSMLVGKGVELDFNNRKEILLEHCTLTHLKEFKKFLWTNKYLEKQPVSNINWAGDINDKMETIEDIFRY